MSPNASSLSLQSQITLMDIPVFKAIQPEVCTLSFTPFPQPRQSDSVSRFLS